MEKFYGVAGVNGYGVYNSYEKVMEAKIYLAKFHNKKFNDFEEAVSWAEEMYYELQQDIYKYQIQRIEKLNWTYYRKKCENEIGY